ncbi:GNAT family N-acetyltransferase, partial [Actinoplanes digitatis]
MTAIVETDGHGVDALTADGGIVTLRPVRPTDRSALATLYDTASPDDLRLRFFAQPGSTALAAEVDRLCLPETDKHLAVLAFEGDDLVGVASCERTGRRAEFALFVAEPQRDRGIGTLLLEHLAYRAHRCGIKELVGEVLPGNTRMLRVARGLTSHAWSRFDYGVVDVGFDIDIDDATQLTIDSRDRTAERASLRALLSPASVAVVGAGHRPGGVGRETLLALRDYHFAGNLYAVNRTGSDV